jgi:chromosome segregation ATPase
MLECFKSKAGGSVYYFEGKRISKREAQNIASSMGKKLPSCSVKTAKNEINSLKKRIKEVMGGRESFKTTSKDLEQKLNACNIIQEKYRNLIAIIDSASDSVDVMNRICLTQDVKRKMDEQYNIIERSLQDSKLKNKELEEEIVSSNNMIKEMTYAISDMKQTNLNLESLIEQERKERAGVQKNLDELTDMCSDRPDLLRTIETLRGRIEDVETVNTNIKVELENTKNINSDMKVYVEELKDSLQTYVAQAKIMDGMSKTIENYKVSIDRYETEVKTLEDENKELRDSIAGNADLQTILDQLRYELTQKSKDEEELRQQLILYDKRYSEAVNKYADDVGQKEEEINELQELNESLTRKVQAMAETAKKLNFNLQQEKDKCIGDVQKAIDEEREISKKEAREFESKIADLNAKLLITEETLEELNKVGKIKDLGEVKEVRASLKKTSKKLKKASI